MNEFLNFVMIVVGAYTLTTIYTLFRICERRKNSLNMFATIAFGVIYVTLLFSLDKIALQFALIAIIALITDKLIKKYMALISHEENEKRLDRFEAFIKAHKQNKRSE